MKVLTHILKELWGLFVEDGSFATATIVWLAIVWFGVARYAPEGSRAALLFLGLAAVMLENVWRTARSKSG